MERIPETVPNLSDESKSFIEGQKNLKNLHQQFKEVLDNIKEISPIIDSPFDVSDEYGDAGQTYTNMQTTPQQEIRMLIREMQSIQSDIKNIRCLVEDHDTGDRAVAAKVIKQLDDLLQMIDSQLFRAEHLLK